MIISVEWPWVHVKWMWSWTQNVSKSLSFVSEKQSILYKFWYWKPLSFSSETFKFSNGINGIGKWLSKVNVSASVSESKSKNQSVNSKHKVRTQKYERDTYGNYERH